MTEDGFEATSKSRYTISHFELSNPLGPGQDDVPALLRRWGAGGRCRAGKEGRGIDLILHPRITRPDGEDWPSIVVYYDYRSPNSTTKSEASGA